MASWEESKKIGDSFEEFAMKDISFKLGYTIEKNDIYENYKYYDFTIVENGINVECKYDVGGVTSKNVCIETHCNGKESGISTSKADYWLISHEYIIYLIKSEDIKRCIYDGYTSLYPEEPTKFRYFTNYPVTQGDGFNKLMDFFIIPARIFKEYCVEVNEANNLTYKELL